MEIGPYWLEGNMEVLKKPFLVTVDSENEPGVLEVKGLAKKRIIFKTRPKPRIHQAKK